MPSKYGFGNSRKSNPLSRKGKVYYGEAQKNPVTKKAPLLQEKIVTPTLGQDYKFNDPEDQAYYDALKSKQMEVQPEYTAADTTRAIETMYADQHDMDYRPGHTATSGDLALRTITNLMESGNVDFPHREALKTLIHHQKTGDYRSEYHDPNSPKYYPNRKHAAELGMTIEEYMAAKNAPDKPEVYVKPGGTATGNIEDYAHFSPERKAEYDARGWEYDDTIDPTAGEDVVTIPRKPVQPIKQPKY